MYCEASSLVDRKPCVAESEACLRIGDVVLSIISDHSSSLNSDLKQFRIAKSDPDIQVTVRWADGIRPVRGQEIFDSGAVWKLCRERGDYVFDFATQAIGLRAYKQMRTSDFISAEMILNAELLPEDAWALEYPADELLVTNYLAHYGLGVEVHGCGLIDRDYGGFLFLGHSGAGKSTTTRLWQSVRNPEILSDDRVILRLRDGELWMYGTPWHGEAAFASNSGAKLTRIFILQHGARNGVLSLPPVQAVGELFARSFPPFHSAQGLQNTIEFLERAVKAVPCYEFQFLPDRSAVEMVRNFHD